MVSGTSIRRFFTCTYCAPSFVYCQHLIRRVDMIWFLSLCAQFWLVSYEHLIWWYCHVICLFAAVCFFLQRCDWQDTLSGWNSSWAWMYEIVEPIKQNSIDNGINYLSNSQPRWFFVSLSNCTIKHPNKYLHMKVGFSPGTLETLALDMLPWKHTTLAGNHQDFASQGSAYRQCKEHIYNATWDTTFEIRIEWWNREILVICKYRYIHV